MSQETFGKKEREKKKSKNKQDKAGINPLVPWRSKTL